MFNLFKKKDLNNMFSHHLIILSNCLFLLLITFFSDITYGQENINKIENEASIEIGKSTTLISEILKEKREIFIYCPKDYNQSKERYPVLFLLDGEDHFLHTAGIVQFLSSNELIPKMIVVGIVNTDRSRDLTPSKIDSYSGGGEQFLKFINNELLPFIDKNYRTQPYRILAGHSLGGLFSTFAFLKSPELFNSYIIISPSLYWDNQILIKIAENSLTSEMKLNKTLYIVHTNDQIEEKYLVPSMKDFINILEAKKVLELKWEFCFMENDDHGSGPHKALYNGLEYIFSGWKIKPDIIKEEGIDFVRKHYKSLSDKYGYEIPVPETVFSILEQSLSEQKKLRKR